MLHLGYKIEDATLHEVDGGNNDDEAVPCSVGQDYPAIPFADYRCNGRFIHFHFIDNAFIVSLIWIGRYCRRQPYTKTRTDDRLSWTKCHVRINWRMTGGRRRASNNIDVEQQTIRNMHTDASHSFPCRLR